MLEISDLSVAFHQYVGAGFQRRHVMALDNVSVTQPAGSILAICGESGAGKSLLADAILGLLPINAHTQGTILWKGQPLSPQDLGSRVRYLPQGTKHIDPQMTVGNFLGLSVADPQAALARFGLKPEVLNAYAHELSGGMLRRVSLATSVGEDTELLIADEPTPGLHPEAVQEVLGYFEELRANGALVLFITHDLKVASTVADRTMVMRHGQVEAIADGPHEFTGYALKLWRAQPGNEFLEAL